MSHLSFSDNLLWFRMLHHFAQKSVDDFKIVRKTCSIFGFRVQFLLKEPLGYPFPPRSKILYLDRVRNSLRIQDSILRKILVNKFANVNVSVYHTKSYGENPWILAKFHWENLVTNFWPCKMGGGVGWKCPNVEAWHLASTLGHVYVDGAISVNCHHKMNVKLPVCIQRLW